MKKTAAANIALCLVVMGWAASFWGLFAHLGDPDPRAPREVIEAENRFYWALFFVGVVAIASAMWLAGFSYSEAKIRSAFVAAATMAPLVGLGVWIALGL